MTMIPSNSPDSHNAQDSRETDKSGRRPRLLWANCFSLLDTSSGAARSVRQMLLQLVRKGYDVEILSAANFDHPRGMTALKPYWRKAQQHTGRFLTLEDGPLKHHTLITAQNSRERMTSAEEAHWFSVFSHFLEQNRPDAVFYFGGKPLDFLVAGEAKYHGIPVAFYLVTGNYKRLRWCRDLDLILTDSRATVDLYKQRLGLNVTPVGTFIDPATVVSPRHSRRHALFINPNYSKGGGIVVRLAQLLEQRRPDIVFEVVQSRGDWNQILEQVTGASVSPEMLLKNVRLTPNTTDMRPIYGRARVLLVPSLWWDSGPRVIPEALMNGIPVLGTASGGIPELIRDGGVVFPLAPKYHEEPYHKIPTDEELAPMVQEIERLYDDTAYYQAMSQKARAVAGAHHNIDSNTGRLIEALGLWLPFKQKPSER